MKTNLARDAEPTVVNCYTFFDKVFPTLGMMDYTEGMYHDDPSTPYDVAQQNQIQYVLDEVRCGPGSRIIDVGCGNGELLAAARRRGAQAVGITISPEQVQLCTDRGLDVRLLNYRNLGNVWRQKFDAVIANGPIEHFVQARDAAAGQDGAIYRRMFQIFHQLIDPRSTVRKMINTTIYFVRPPEPRNLLASPFRFRWGSDNFHWAMLERSFGGWYPRLGQLESCATGAFQLTKTVDGTQDYHLTSEHWLRRVRSEMLRLRGAPRLLSKSLGIMVRHPRQCVTMLTCMLVAQSWNWQFRTANPPTRLLRQTWDYVDGGAVAEG
ncbi:MAG: cyclopropane-fatty-acyl-phospholipid synthase family protein [Pirellulales bacterium]